MPLRRWTKAVLTFLHRLAHRLHPWRPLILGVVVVFAAMAFIGLGTRSTGNNALLQVGLSGTLWGLMLLATIELFQQLPETPASRHGFIGRFKLRLAWGFYMLMALVILFGCLLLLGTSVRLMNV